MKHIFPNHPENKVVRTRPIVEAIQKQMGHIFPLSSSKFTGNRGLSHFCIHHTIDKGFCIRCGKQQIKSRAEGMCNQCVKDIEYIIKQDPICRNSTVRELTAELLRRSDMQRAPYVVRHDV